MKSLYDLPVKSLGHNEDYQSRLEDLRYRAKFPNLSNYMIGVNDLVVRFICDSAYATEFTKTADEVWADIESIDVDYHFERVQKDGFYSLTPKLTIGARRDYDDNLGKVLSIDKTKTSAPIEFLTEDRDTEAANLIKDFCDEAWAGVF